MSNKNALQEFCQATGLQFPLYNTVRVGGPDHSPVFKAECTIARTPPHCTVGYGSSKSEAEAEAAALMLQLVKPPVTDKSTQDSEALLNLQIQLDTMTLHNKNRKATMTAVAREILTAAALAAYQLDPDLSGEIMAGSFNPYGNGQTSTVTYSYALAALKSLQKSLTEAKNVLAPDVYDTIEKLCEAALSEATTVTANSTPEQLLYDAVSAIKIKESNLDLRKVFEKASNLIGLELMEELKTVQRNHTLIVRIGTITVMAHAVNLRHLYEVTYEKLLHKITPKSSTPLFQEITTVLSEGPLALAELRRRLRNKGLKFRTNELNATLYTHKDSFISVIEHGMPVWSLL